MPGRLRILSLFILKGLLVLAPAAGAVNISYAYYNVRPLVSIRDTPKKRPLIVWIHGCGQNEGDFVNYTAVIEKTKHLDPLIIAPYQNSKINILKCWNFLSKEMQDRKGTFMEVVNEVQRNINTGEVDPDRVFVGGFSSGGIFANHLAMCFPEVFKGALVHSGAPFDVKKSLSTESAVESADEAINCAAGEISNRRLKTLLYVHGTDDKVVPLVLGQRAFMQSVKYMDALDDYKLNNSYSVKSLDKQRGIHVRFKDGTRAHFMSVENMGHRWSGSKPGADFSSPDTVSSLDFFLRLTQELK